MWGTDMGRQTEHVNRRPERERESRASRGIKEPALQKVRKLGWNEDGGRASGHQGVASGL